MGFKKYASCLLVAVTLLNPHSYRAETAEDLYKMYGLDYKTDVYQQHLSTIQKYESAKKFVAMYQYIIYSEYDTKQLEQRISDLKSELEEIHSELLSGYNKDINDIYDLESRYQFILKQIEDTEKSLVTYDIPYEIPTKDNTPSYKEYKLALNETTKYFDIGEIRLLKLPGENFILKEKKKTSATYTTAVTSNVLATIDGRVVDITDGAVSISHHNNIYTYYGGLDYVSVNVGDYIRQYDVIGTCSDTLVLKLKIQKDLYDVTRMFKEVDLE